jgi:hypothetical protein
MATDHTLNVSCEGLAPLKTESPTATVYSNFFSREVPMSHVINITTSYHDINIATIIPNSPRDSREEGFRVPPVPPLSALIQEQNHAAIPRVGIVIRIHNVVMWKTLTPVVRRNTRL